MSKSIDLSTMVANSALMQVKYFVEREILLVSQKEAFNNDHSNFIDGELKQLNKVLEFIKTFRAEQDKGGGKK